MTFHQCWYVAGPICCVNIARWASRMWWKLVKAVTICWGFFNIVKFYAYSVMYEEMWRRIWKIISSGNFQEWQKACARVCMLVCECVCVCVCVCVRPLLGTHRLVNFQEGRWSNLISSSCTTASIMLFVCPLLKMKLKYFVFQQRCVRQNIQSDMTWFNPVEPVWEFYQYVKRNLGMNDFMNEERINEQNAQINF